MMQEVVLQACASVDTKVRTMQRTIDATRNRTYQEHAERFREQYFTIGELMYRKERAIEELRRKIQTLNIQQDVAMETFNPRANALSRQRAEVELEMAEVQEYLGRLRAKADAYVEAFKPTEKALRATSQSFTHPVYELKQLNKLRSRKVDQYYAQTVLEAQKMDTAALNGVDPRHVVSSPEVEAERQMIQREQEVVARRKAEKVGTGPQPTVGRMTEISRLSRQAEQETFTELQRQREVAGLGGGDDGAADDNADGTPNKTPQKKPRRIRSVITHQALTGPTDADPFRGTTEGDALSPEQSEATKQLAVLAERHAISELSVAHMRQRARGTTGERHGALALSERLEAAGGRALRELRDIDRRVVADVVAGGGADGVAAAAAADDDNAAPPPVPTVTDLD